MKNAIITVKIDLQKIKKQYRCYEDLRQAVETAIQGEFVRNLWTIGLLNDVWVKKIADIKVD